MNKLNILAAAFALFASAGAASAHETSCCTVDFIVRFHAVPPAAMPPGDPAAFKKLITPPAPAPEPASFEALLRNLQSGR